jgi:hypothetical protein
MTNNNKEMVLQTPIQELTQGDFKREHAFLSSGEIFRSDGLRTNISPDGQDSLCSPRAA